jgi:hypothetical protein
MKKIKCALIGPGNIGTDLLAKLQRSPVLEPVWMVGIDPASDGLKKARELGLSISTKDAEAAEEFGDQLDVVLLAEVFRLDGGPQFGVGLGYQVVFCIHAFLQKVIIRWRRAPILVS